MKRNVTMLVMLLLLIISMLSIGIVVSATDTSSDDSSIQSEPSGSKTSGEEKSGEEPSGSETSGEEKSDESSQQEESSSNTTDDQSDTQITIPEGAVAYVEEASTYYTTLKEAIEACASSEKATIKLVDNVTLASNESPSNRTDMTIDLNGYTINMDTSNTIANGKNLIITDNSAEKNGKIVQSRNSKWNNAIFYNSGTVQILYGTMEYYYLATVENGTIIVGSEENAGTTDGPFLNRIANDTSTKVMFYSGRIDKDVSSGNITTLKGYNLLDETYENVNVYVTAMDDTQPTVVAQGIYPNKNATKDDRVYIYLWVSDDMLTETVNTEEHANIVNKLIIKVNGEEKEADIDATIFPLIIISGLTGDGELTIEVPENIFFDKAGNGNEGTEVTTGITVDNTAPENTSVLINNGAKTTTSNIVNLKLEANGASHVWIKNPNYEVPSFEVDGVKVSVPYGFEVAELNENGDVIGTIEQEGWETITREQIDNGLVIVEVKESEDGSVEYGNEFVWVPCTLDGSGDTIKFGERRYVFIYFLSATGLTNYLTEEQVQEIIKNIYLTADEMREALEKLLDEIEIASNARAIGMPDPIEEREQYIEELEYYINLYNVTTGEDNEEILGSVEKYGGFYIGRYLIGYDASSLKDMEDILQLEYYVQKGKDIFVLPYYLLMADIAEDIHPGLTRITGMYSWDVTFLQVYNTYIKAIIDSNVEINSGVSTYIASMPPMTGEDKILNIYEFYRYPEWIDEYSSVNEQGGQTYGAAPSVGANEGWAVTMLVREYFKNGIGDSFYPARPVIYVSEVPEWIPYPVSEDFTIELSEGLGEKTVEVYFKDEAGNVTGPITETITVKRKSSGSSPATPEKFENTLIARDDEYRGYMGETIKGSLEWTILENDETEKEVEIEVKEITSDVSHGTLYKNKNLTIEGINEDGTFYYVPDEDYIGTDEFSYTITDGTNTSEEATVTLVVRDYKLIEEDGTHTWYIRGYTDGTVKPNNNITREEIAMVFYRLTISEDKNTFVAMENIFEDVEPERWSSEAIAYLYEKGIMNGYPDGEFKPLKPITRAEFATIIERYLNICKTTDTKFKDVSSNYWAEEAISRVVAEGWMKGYEDGTFKPEKNITRAETMTAINRMLSRKIEDASERLNMFSDLSKDFWAYDDVIEATATHDYTKDEDGNEVWQTWHFPT